MPLMLAARWGCDGRETEKERQEKKDELPAMPGTGRPHRGDGIDDSDGKK